MKTLNNKIAIFAAAAALAASARGETVTAEPDALLDYIEATGSQYIDTGVNAETGLKAIIDFAWADEDLSGVDWSLLDACTSSTDADKRSRFFMCHMLNGKPYFAYGLKQRKNPAGAVPFVRGERCMIITDMSSTNSLELTQNGANTFDATDRETFATNGYVNLHLNLFVFATNFGGSPSGYGKGKLYELKIFKKNTTTGEFDLLRHYIPCIKDGRAGLYDKVNGTISFSIPKFIAGSVTNTVTATTLAANEHDGQYWTTFYHGTAGYKIDDSENATAYTATRNGDKLTLTSIGKNIPKNTAVIIKGTDNSISLTRDYNITAYNGDNQLEGVNYETPQAANTTYYVLSKKDDNFGFYKLASSKSLAAHKAYLEIDQSGTPARDFYGFDFEETTSLSEELRVKSEEFATATDWYTLDGRKLQGKPTQKGIYIHNGRKEAIQ